MLNQNEGRADLLAWTDDSNVRHFLNADCVLSFRHEATVELTDHSVELGANVTDHVKIQPFTVELEITHSNTPVYPTEGYQTTDAEITYVGVPSAFARLLAGTAAGAIMGAAVGGLPAPIADGGAIGVAAGASAVLGGLGLNDLPTETMVVHVLQADTPRDRINDLVDELLRVLGSRPVTLSQRGRRFESYIVTKISVEYGKTAKPTIKLSAQTFRTVTAATTTLPDPKTLRAQPNKSTSANTKDGAGSKPKFRSSLVDAGIAVGALQP